MARLSPAGGRLVAFLVALLLLWPSWTASPVGASASPDKPDDTTTQPEEVPDELIVGFKHGASKSARDAAVAAQGGQTTAANDRFDFRVVKIPPGQQKKEAIAKYLNDPAVRYAEPNYVYHSTLEPDDPKYTDGTLWGLKNTGQTVGTQAGTADADIDAELAWATTTGSSDVVVGVVDTGITYTHPDLAANIWSAPAGWTINGCAPGTHGYRKTGGTASCDPADDHYHGTHVAGTIGAKGNNGTGVVGVNWNVQIMGLKFLNAGGNGSTDDAVTVLDYALQAREAGVNLRVLNNSWGGGGYSQALYDAIAALGNAGVLFVASAGNKSNNNDASPSYPGSYNLPNIVAVAATDNRDQLASFSNYGATTVDLGAPGVNIYSTVPTSAAASGYAYLSGTSMAAPHVSGVAALVLSAPGLGNLTTTQLKQRLLYCGDPIPALATKTLSGRRLNAANSVAGCSLAFTVSITPARGGTASVTPVAPTYDIETQITLTATADTGFAFMGWQINGTGRGSANPLTFAITSNLTVVPVFARTTPFENFDTVTAPALPPGWTTSRTGATCGGGDSGPWRTVTDSWDTAPNAAFAGDPNCVSDNSLVSPAFVVPNNHTLLSFRHRYDLETSFDGGVLEIALGGGSFADIVAAGGSFIAGGYSGTIDTHYSNPLAGRQAWSGASGTWVTTTLTLPPAAGQTVQLRWRLGSDNAVAKTGWWVDSIVVDRAEPTVLSVAAASGPYGGTATLSATLTAGGANVGGKTIAFTIDGTPACGTGGTPACPATGGDGVATLPNVSLAGQAAGAHPGAIGASFAGDAVYDPSSGSADLTVAKLAQTITFGALSDRLTSDPSFAVSATASSGLPVTFTAGPPAVCTASGVNGATISPVGAGTCTVTANQAGDATYAAAAVAQQFALTANLSLLTVTIHGPGTVGPGSGNYPPGPIALTATPDTGAIFLGWTVDGTFAGWNPALALTLGGPRTVVATFLTRPGFSDVATTDPAWAAITELAARGVIKGYGDGRFGPDDPVLRAQVAALLVRAFGWDNAAPGAPSPFSDLEGLDPELQRAVAILAARGIAQGYPDGTFDPTGEVLRIQVISFVTRSMVQAGYWQAVTQDDTNVYPNVPLDSGHRLDLLTFVKYAGAIPGQPVNQPWAGWNTSGPRAWTAQVLWQALDSYFSANHVP
jgi:subtilisin family serine protease